MPKRAKPPASTPEPEGSSPPITNPTKSKPKPRRDLSGAKYYEGTQWGDWVFAIYPQGRFRLSPRLDLLSVSPDGYSWGIKTGSGPAQLAFAVLMDALDDEDRAKRLYQRFKHRAFVNIPKDAPWKMTRDQVMSVVDAIEEIEQETAGERAAVARQPKPVVFEGGQDIVWDSAGDMK